MSNVQNTEQAPTKMAYSVIEACKQVGVSRTHLYGEIKDKRLPVRKCGRRTLIRAEDLDAWLANLNGRED